MIWGNNDGEKVDITKASFREESQLTVSLNNYDFLEFGGRKLFICHYDDLAKPMATSGLYDAVFFGHNHIVSEDKVGETIVVNPGELAAMKSGKATIAIYETKDNLVEIIELENVFSMKSDFVDQYFKDNMDRLGFRSKDSFNQSE